MNVGGPAVLISELIQNLPQKEISHTLITGVCPSNEIDFLNSHPLNSEVIYLDHFRRSILPTSDFISLLRIIKILRQLRPDLVHTHTSKAGVLGRIAVKIASPDSLVVHTYHGHLLYGYFGKCKTVLVVSIERILGRFTNKYIAVTRQVRDDLYQAGIGPFKKWNVIYPGVRELSTNLDFQTVQGSAISQEKINIAWIGRFTDIKNPMLAIQAFESIPERDNLNLIMIGAGELFEECENYARNFNLSITFTGWVTDINPILTNCDFVLMTSRNEGMPVVIVESAFKAVPVVSTNVGGVSEFIEDGVTGWLVGQDLESISKKVFELSKNILEIQRVGKNARKLAEKSFSVENYVANHVKLYKDLLNNRIN